MSGTATVLPMKVGVCGTPVLQRGGKWYTHHSTGRLVAELARRVTEVRYYSATSTSDGHDIDFCLDAANIHVTAWSPRSSTVQAMRHPWRVAAEYRQLIIGVDAVFLRGSPPLVWVAHFLAAWKRVRVVHWIVGNPLAVLLAERRGYSPIVHKLGIAFALFERWMTRAGIWASRATVLANGAECATLFRTSRTRQVVSTTITAGDFRERDDTCDGARIRLLFVGFIRPEKGVEYLIRALPDIRAEKPVELAIVGGWTDFEAEYERLNTIASELGVRDRIMWQGYARFGQELFSRIDDADVLVLPSLSEGTPRVLVEARARSVPVVSTRVGGIPSSVRDGEDGLLVPPKDSVALAAAINRIIGEPDFRRHLIRAGRVRVREWTVENFAELVLSGLGSENLAA